MKVRNRKISHWLVLCAALAIAGLVLAACGGGGGTAGAATATATNGASTATGAPGASPTGTAATTPTEANGGSGGAASTIDVDEHEFAIVPKDQTAKAGEITFVIKNTGAVEHDLHWDVNGGETSPMVAPGKTVTWKIKIDKPGTYQGWCTVPGHKEAGMVATLTVK